MQIDMYFNVIWSETQPYLWRGSESNTWRCCMTAALQWSWGALPPHAGCPTAVLSAGPETWGWGWRCCGWCSWPELPSLSADSCRGETGQNDILKKHDNEIMQRQSVIVTTPNEVGSFITCKFSLRVRWSFN